MMIVRRLVPGLLCLLVTTACAVKSFTPPTGSGTPFPEFAAAFDEATRECRGVKTMSVTLSLSGRAGSTRLRGNVDAGFSAPGAVRLEGRAPFGRPVFILVTQDPANATLLLPRDNRVLRDTPAAAIVEALAGVSLDPDELRSVIAGCGFGAAAPSGGRVYGADMAVLDLPGSTQYLRRENGRWRLIAAARGPLTIEYRDVASSRPGTVRMTTASTVTESTSADLTMKLSDVNINVPFEADVFKIDITPGADPLTLDELRRAGPLGAAAPR
jgi:outer membrane lipoprotein-sorting protein